MTLAGTASAQSANQPAGEARGLRYLSWSGRGEPAAPTAVSDRASPPARGLRRPNTVIPHGGVAGAQPAAPAAAARRTLTPANAWLQPAPPAPEAQPASAPTLAAAVPAPVQPMRASQPQPQPRPTPEYLPDQGGRGQPVPADIAYAPAPAIEPTPVQGDPADPMAPRRDAPIFRLQRDAPSQPAPPPAQAAASDAPDPTAPTRAPQPRRVAEVTNTGERPPQQGARYYSVHRQNGRQPDALEMPAPTYIDALAVTMTETPASQDLAAPEQGPTLIRDNQGRIRPTPAASDGDHQ